MGIKVTVSPTYDLKVTATELAPSSLLSRNSDSVLCSGYYTVSSTITPAGAFKPTSGRSFCHMNNLTKIRQNGNITTIKFFITNISDVTECFFDVWRKDGATWDRVTHSDIFSLLSNGINTITLPASVAVLEGDYTGISGKQNTAGTFLFNPVVSSVNSKYVDAYPAAVDYNWTGAVNYGYYIPIQTYIQAPLVVGIGDSLMAGHDGNFSNIENSSVVDLDGHILAQLYALNSKYVYQNMGIGSNTSTMIAARFSADVVALKPRVCIIGPFMAGLIAAESKATMIANLTTMLNYCAVNNIVPVVCKITPSTDRSNAEMQARDDTMASFKTLVEGLYDAVWCDFDSTIGEFRVGGDAGNLWNIKAIYDGDGTHLNQAGYTAMASVINTAIIAKYTFA